VIAALKCRAAEQREQEAREERDRSLKIKLDKERKSQRIAAMKLKVQQRAEVR